MLICLGTGEGKERVAAMLVIKCIYTVNDSRAQSQLSLQGGCSRYLLPFPPSCGVTFNVLALHGNF